MNQIAESLQEYLKGKECVFDLDAEAGVVHFGIDGCNARWRAMGFADEGGGFVLLSQVPLLAAEPRRATCAELVIRYNAKLALGRFDLDFEDGKLLYVTTAQLGGAPLSQEVIGHVVSGHQFIVDSFIPALAATLFAGTTAEEALKIEGQEAQEPEPSRFSLN